MAISSQPVNRPRAGAAPYQAPGQNQQAQQAQTNAYQQQTQYNNQQQQNQLDLNERNRQDALSRSRADDMALQLWNDPNTTRTTDGTSYQISTPGGGGRTSSGATSGIAIGGGVYPNLPAMPPTVPPPPRVSPPLVPQNTGMFAHAKDVSGRVGNKAIEALRNMMTKRGISDSGLAVEGEANILGNIARQQSDAEYDQAQINTGRQWEANQLGYQGDMGQNALGYQGGIQQRGQDINAMLAMLRNLY